MQVGKALNLNPFLREIWAVSYNGVVSIFVGRDGYRKNAVIHPDYDGHSTDSIYADDVFRVVAGVPEHEYGNERKQLIGAYCVCWKKSTKVPYFVAVKFGEYFNGMSPIWKTKPETMIKKVAEAQCLRGAFPTIFTGTYDDSENWGKKPFDDKEVTSASISKQSAKLLDPARHSFNSEVNQALTPANAEFMQPEKPEQAKKKTRKKTEPIPANTPAPVFIPPTPPEIIPPAESIPQTDNKKYNIPSEKTDMSGIVSYNPNNQSEHDNLYRHVVTGWNMLGYHEVARINSLKKHTGKACLNDIDDNQTLNDYLTHLRAKYQEKIKGEKK
jgi:phage recombination protein Bet